ncbi:hypothetical protein Ddye_031850 [Dipteronia dyeriana]|uniref:Clustered mitochondria protein homolog n=1 Tax=Dipteronia dyeriana TaxID=168575 RepID=A0AAD9TK48_9ROSI|nr:hypothetical protein Ddye_031850 [Dipteronia dyeriana]
MAGKSNKGRNRKGSHSASNSAEQVVSSDAPTKDDKIPLESATIDDTANGVAVEGESTVAQPEVKESEIANPANEPKQGDIHLYPVSVKTQSSEKLELQLNPGDSVMDIRQFLLDAPETCFFTCYDLLLQTKDGSTHHLEDYNEISEVADITTGGCSLEMVAALYDDRSIRAHVHRTRDLLSLSTLHASLSTSLAMQYENAQSKVSSAGDAVKTEVPELDGLGFMEDVSGSLGKLLSSSTQEIKCVESIVFSSFNPPPSYRRLVGDLIYLDVVTLEGNKYCITGTTKMFYVNSSTGTVLDPRPSKSTSEATTLIGLLQKISSKFKKAFREILERKANAHPFENVQSLLPPNSWLGLYPVPGKILRDRALYKVTSDFVDAAISGAVGVISRCIPPINPTDPECFHIVYINISSLSVLPGILQGDKSDSLLYGSVDNGKKICWNEDFHSKVGISITARKYDFNAATPFQTSDILNLQPVVKHSVPVCSEAKNLVEMGKVQLAEGLLSEAYTLFSEAFSILQQVTGPMHREVANCCRYLAMVLYHAGDMAGAIMQQHKELIINERCLGLDHPDTAHSYGNMALFYHGLNQTELALRHMSRALLLLSLSSGPDHPDVAATFINVAMMYQDIGKMDTALRYLQEALKKNERLLGEEHIQTAVCYHALAIAFNCMGAFKLSHQHEKKTYDILVKQLGEEDSRTKDSQNWMKTFKMRELQMNAQKQKGQAFNAASTQKAIDILKAHPDLIHAFQAVAAAGGSGSSGSSVNNSVGDNLPRGRGFDERAARAAAEIRKKAAAKGLLKRPHGLPAQALPPITQLFNLINTGAAPDANGSDASGTADVANKEANGHPSEDPADTKKVQPLSGLEGEAPVGLGKGLTSLDSKKQKSKAKAAA